MIGNEFIKKMRELGRGEIEIRELINEGEHKDDPIGQTVEDFYDTIYNLIASVCIE